MAEHASVEEVRSTGLENRAKGQATLRHRRAADKTPSTIGIVGAGVMGRAALKLLSQEFGSAEFRVFDRSSAALQAAAELAPGRINKRKQEVSGDRLLDLAGCDIIFNFAGPFYSGDTTIARSAVRHGCWYVDICDDVEGARAIFELDAEATRANIPLMSGAGFSPGLTNVLARRIKDQISHCDGIEIGWVTYERTPGGLAPLRHMLHMTVAPCPQWRNGRLIDTPGFVSSTAQVFRFPEPIGEIECYDTAHPEPLQLSRTFPGLAFVTCKGAMWPEWANATFSSLGRLGFGDPSLRVTVDDREVDPQEFLWRMLWARHERRARRSPEPERHGFSAVQVIGHREGSRLVRLSLIDAMMSRATALGAVTIGLALLEQRLPAGVRCPEELDASGALTIFERLRRKTDAFGEGLITEWLNTVEAPGR